MPLNTVKASVMPSKARNLTRGSLLKGRLGEITFQVNPTSIIDSGGREWINVVSAGMRPIPVSTGWKPRTLTFDMLFNYNIFVDLDMERVLSLLKIYRNSDATIKFVFGEAYAVDCNVIDCPIQLESFYWNLSVTEIKIPITLQVVEVRK
jgi:hypothetical protein